MKIMMVESNQIVIEMMNLFFDKESWFIKYERNGKSALDTFKKDSTAFDLIILELDLIGVDGIRLAQNFKEINPEMPLIILTSRDSESDQILGFTIGADDYVTKPFSPLVLIARIKSLIKRTEKINQFSMIHGDSNISTEHLKMDLNKRTVTFDKKPIDQTMTPKEFNLLYTLASNTKKVFTRKDLLTLVWDYSYFGDERTVDVHIKKLRKHFTGFKIQPIKTVWGVGYKFDDTGSK